MIDEKLREWFHIAFEASPTFSSISKFEGEIQTEQVRSVASIFLQNSARAFRIPLLLLKAFYGGRMDQIVRLGKKSAESGSIFPFVGSLQEVTTEASFLQQETVDVTKLPPLQLAMVSDLYDAIWWGSDSGLSNTGMLMFMQITWSWTVIETMLGDLWETAVNVHPRGLVSKFGSIKVASIELHKFDVKDKMGTLLRMNKAASFTSLDETIDAYECAFQEQSKGIMDALSDQSIRALSILRNLIAHKGGKCDKMYAEDRKKVSGAFLLPNVEEDKMLQPDGEMIGKILPQSLKSCSQLIKAVDAWIVGHK